MKILGIDIGSSFLKAAVIDLDRACICEESKEKAPQKNIYSDPYLFEVPAVCYTRYLTHVLDEMAAKYQDLNGVLLSTQMHGFIYSSDGREDTYISWQDMRCLHQNADGISYLELLKKRFPKESMDVSGVYLKPALGFANLYTLLDENPDISRSGTLYTLGSYLIHHLTGNNICHASNAGPLGLLNVKEHCWNTELVQRLGFNQIRLPELVEGDYDCCGFYRTAGRDIAVFPDYGDQQVAVVGSLPRKGEGLINIATASQVGMLSEHFQTGDYEIRPYFENVYLLTISNMPAGRGLDVLIHFLRDVAYRMTGADISIAETWKRVEKDFIQDSKGLRVDMTFYETADNTAGGSISSIHPSNFNVHTLISAAFQDMADTYKKNLMILSGGKDLPSVVCSGGVSWKQPALRAVIEQTMGCECRLSALEDEVVSGMYRVGLCCMKKSGSIFDEPDRILQV